MIYTYIFLTTVDLSLFFAVEGTPAFRNS